MRPNQTGKQTRAIVTLAVVGLFAASTAIAAPATSKSGGMAKLDPKAIKVAASLDPKTLKAITQMKPGALKTIASLNKTGALQTLSGRSAAGTGKAAASTTSTRKSNYMY